MINEFFSEHYLGLKAFHIICIICWMAGVFYFPRLLVYHVQNKNKPEVVAVFKVMQERLYKIIMRPAMILSLISGILLVNVTYVWSSGWMHLKLLAVIFLVIYQFLLNYWRQCLATHNCHHSEKFFRIINEIPTLLLIVIVVCVILKPF